MAMQQVQVGVLPRLNGRAEAVEEVVEKEAGEGDAAAGESAEVLDGAGEGEQEEELQASESEEGAGRARSASGPKRFKASLDVDLENETDVEKIKAAAKRAQAEWERAENDRRKEQSFRGQAESDLGKALDALQAGLGQKAEKAETATSPTIPDVASILAELDADGDGYANKSDVKNVLAKLLAANQQAAQGGQIKQAQATVQAILDAKPDVDETISYGKQAKLLNDKEFQYLGALGNYYRIQHHKLSAEMADKIKEAEERGKQAGLRAAKKAQEKADSIPTMNAGGRAPGGGVKAPKGGVVDFLLQRRKARGIN